MKPSESDLTAKGQRVLIGLDQFGWDNGLSAESLNSIGELPLRGNSFPLAAIACELLMDHQPITLRGLFYRVVSAGFFPDTSQRYYAKLGNLLTTLRRSGLVPYRWIVDNIRATIKPSSWSGLEDFADTVGQAYRRNFWASLPDYVHIFVEKDAMTGVIAPVTQELDVPLSPVRGYVSDSYAYEIGSTWRRIDKPIHAYYIGDFDPSGFDLERSLREKLGALSGRQIVETDRELCVDLGFGIPFQATSIFDDDEVPTSRRCTWTRLALTEEDFGDHDLIELPVKESDSRSAAFIERYGERCAEVDALPPGVIRNRVHNAIMRHVPADEWERLKDVERLERETWKSTVGSLSGGGDDR